MSLENSGLEHNLIGEYLDGIFNYAYRQTMNHADAEDLAQDIMLEIVTARRRTTEIRNESAWVWKIARNVFCHWLNRKKQHNHINCNIDSSELQNTVFQSPDHSSSTEDGKNQLTHIKREISLLAKRHRNVFTAYYLEGISCDEIARREKIPAGTVKRLLFESRQTIRKGVSEMQQFGTRSHSPARLAFAVNGRSGNNGKPYTLVQSLLSQNLILEASEEAKDVRQLSLATGTPAAYVEDELERLVDGELMRREGRNSYRTDFFIFLEKWQKSRSELNRECSRILRPQVDNALLGLKESFTKGLLGNQNKKWNEAAWSLLLVLCEISYETMLESITESRPRRKDGGQWWAIGFESGKCFSQTDKTPNEEDRLLKPEDCPEEYFSGVYQVRYEQETGMVGFSAMKTRWTPNQLFEKRENMSHPLLEKDELELCWKVARQHLDEPKLDDSDKEILTTLIQKGLIEKSENSFNIKATVFSTKQHNTIHNIVKNDPQFLNACEDTLKPIEDWFRARASSSGISVKELMQIAGLSFLNAAIALIINDLVAKEELITDDYRNGITPSMYLLLPEK